jgi:hypothetical protein
VTIDELHRVSSAAVRPDRDDRRRVPRPMLVVLVLFVLIHVLEAQVIHDNGVHYLDDARAFSEGTIARSRYSPGWSLMLAPAWWITDGGLLDALRIADLITLGISVAGLWVTYRVLVRHLDEPLAVALVGVLAVGQSATVFLEGAEVEPLVFLGVAVLLAWGNRRDPAAFTLACVLAAARIAVVPFLAVLWFAHHRRSWRGWLGSAAISAVGAVAYWTTRPLDGSDYTAIAGDTYASSSDRRIVGVLDVVVEHVWRYARYGVPSVIWPGKALDSLPGVALGLATTAVLLVMAVTVLRKAATSSSAPERELAAPVVALLAHVAVLTTWPANDPTLTRLTLIVSPVILILAGLAVVTIRERAPRGLGIVTQRGVVVAALVAGLAASSRYVVDRNLGHEVRDMVRAAEQVDETLPPGPLQATYRQVVEIASGRPTAALSTAVGPGAPAGPVGHAAGVSAAAGASVADLGTSSAPGFAGALLPESATELRDRVALAGGRLVDQVGAVVVYEYPEVGRG